MTIKVQQNKKRETLKVFRLKSKNNQTMSTKLNILQTFQQLLKVLQPNNNKARVPPSLFSAGFTYAYVQAHNC